MLYLPPNVAHHGIALEPGMTWSIGSRAPSGADLLQGLGEWLAFTDNEGGRYSDPDLKSENRAGEIDGKALLGLRDLMRAGIDGNDALHNYLAAFMSRFRLANEPMPPGKILQAEDLRHALQQGAELLRNPWTRLTWVENANGARLYATGQAFDCSTRLAEALCQCEQPQFDENMLDQYSLDTLTGLVNNGHFLLTTDAQK